MRSVSIRKRDVKLFKFHRRVLIDFVNISAVDVVVEDVSLLGRVTGFADLVSQVAFVRLGVGAGGRDYVLFDHNGAHIVGAEAECALAELEPLREPRRLYVLNIVEEEARDGEHF